MQTVCTEALGEILIILVVRVMDLFYVQSSRSTAGVLEVKKKLIS